MTVAGGHGGPVRRAATLVWPDGTETVERLTEAQRDGRACIRCSSLTLHAAPVAHINGAGPVYSCCSSSIPASFPGLEPPAQTDHAEFEFRISEAGPGSANLSGGPRDTDSGPGCVGVTGKCVRRPPAVLALATIVANLVWAWIGDIIIGGARFGGPLTTSGRLPIAPGAPEPDPRACVPANNRPGVPDPVDGLTAYDCLFNCQGGCVNSYGEPIRAGMSCWTSARLMSSRDFETAHPQLYLAAVARGILTPEPAVV